MITFFVLLSLWLGIGCLSICVAYLKDGKSSPLNKTARLNIPIFVLLGPILALALVVELYGKE